MPRDRPPDEGRLIQGAYYIYVAGSAVARALPEKIAYRTADVTGRVKARITRKQASAVAENIARITGLPARSRSVRGLVLDAYASYARYWLETFRLVREERSFFLDRFRCATEHRIDEVLARGKGAVIVVGHLGNYDAAGAWVASTGRKLVTVAEVVRPRRLYDFFVEHRERLGMTIHPAQKGAVDVLVDAVEDGAVVAILGDRTMSKRGIEVDFFGEKTLLPPGPAAVALRAGVPLLVAGVYAATFEDGKRGWTAEIGEPIELPEDRGTGAVEELTQRVADELQRFIAKRPEEWHVFRRFWLADPG